MSNLISKIKLEHCNDAEQLYVLTSDSTRLMVEAPAGYGKTKTMINKIKYLILNHQLPKYKKILCLTFSVNSTNKIIKDISESFKDENYDVMSLIRIGNYHSLAMSLIAKYGYLIESNLKKISELQIIPENGSNISTLSESDKKFLSDFTKEIKEAFESSNFYEDKIIKYNKIIKSHFLSNNCITYNAFITLAIELLSEFPEVQNFYQVLYPIVFIDEFQDTNILSYNLINLLTNNSTKLYLFGDSMQKIYGFIGAIPNLIDKMTETFEMDYKKLKTNYRFKNNEMLLLLDTNLRKNIANFSNPNVDKSSNVKFYLSQDQLSEAEKIKNILEVLKENSIDDVAILFRERSKNTFTILNCILKSDIAVFNGLFNQNDSDYVGYHDVVLTAFNDFIKDKKNKSFTKRDISQFMEIISRDLTNSSHMRDSFDELLLVFLQSICSDLNYYYRNEAIRNVLLNKELKNYIKNINRKVIITTIHSAKGLEWDYVILPDLEDGIFPNMYYMKNIDGSIIEDRYIDELCIFYVGVTRARKDILLSGSQKQFGRGQGQNSEFPTTRSDFLKRPGINIKLITSEDFV